MTPDAVDRPDPRARFRRRVFRDPAYFLAAGFGTGLLPWMPGTWGTLLALGLWLALLQHGPVWLQGLIVAVALVLGIAGAGRITRELGVEDHQGIVWDEVVGYWLTLLFVPAAAPRPVWAWALAGFVLFRLFDIVKPWPIRALERRLHGGAGVMLDDVLAGVYAGVALLAIAGATRAMLA